MELDDHDNFDRYDAFNWLYSVLKIYRTDNLY